MRRVLPPSSPPDHDEHESELPDELGPIRLEDLTGTLRGAAPRRIDPPPRLEILDVLRRNLLQATLMSIVPVVIGVSATASVWVGGGAVRVHQAATATRAAEVGFHDALEAVTQPALAELAVLGAPVDQVEIVYFAWADAPTGEHRTAADTLLVVLNDQAVSMRAHHGPRGSSVAPTLAPANEARREVARQWTTWDDASRALSGRAAVVLGMVDAPPPTMDVYAWSHPSDP